MRREPSFLIVLLFFTLFFSFRTRPVRAWENIHIRADGSIDPPTAPIMTSDNITYILTEDLVNQTINVDRNDTIIDGNGHTLQAKGSGIGIKISGALRDVTIKNFHIYNFLYGITGFPDGAIWSSAILNNTFMNNGYGLFFHYFNDAYIQGNTFVSNGRGMYLADAYRYEVLANNITGNGRGIEINNCAFTKVYNNLFHNNTRALRLVHSFYATIYHNNFMNSTIPIESILSQDSWNSSYPIGGNYWSYLNVTDIYSGPYQNESGSDGIGDSPYIVWDQGNIDYYPLVNPYWNPADINHDSKIDIFDVVLCANAYGSTPSDPHWNPLCDFTEPYGKVDIFDVVAICISYREEYTP